MAVGAAQGWPPRRPRGATTVLYPPRRAVGQPSLPRRSITVDPIPPTVVRPPRPPRRGGGGGAPRSAAGPWLLGDRRRQAEKSTWPPSVPCWPPGPTVPPGFGGPVPTRPGGCVTWQRRGPSGQEAWATRSGRPKLHSQDAKYILYGQAISHSRDPFIPMESLEIATWVRHATWTELSPPPPLGPSGCLQGRVPFAAVGRSCSRGDGPGASICRDRRPRAVNAPTHRPP